MIKAFHVFFMIAWVGQLMVLLRLLAKHDDQPEEAKLKLGEFYSRAYNFGQLPAMILALTFGLVLISQVNLAYKPGWFHMKIFMIMVLVGCDQICAKWVGAISRGHTPPKARAAHALHGVTGLTIIAIVISVYVVRDKEGEMKEKWLAEKGRSVNIVPDLG
jgi:putative membrane protein